MLSYSTTGDWSMTEHFLEKMREMKIQGMLQKYAQMGTDYLRALTPMETGLTAASWSSEVERTGSGWAIHWSNSNVNQGVNIALILQLGHGTGTGGYVTGLDYINPAIEPVFRAIANEAFQEVSSA